MKSLVEYIEEQMLLEYAGVFNGAGEIAEDIFKLLVDSIQHNKTDFTYNKYALDLLGSFTGASVEKGCYLGMSIVILSCLGVSLMLLKKRGIKG